MEVYEKINALIVARGMTKSEFAARLVALRPILRSTGETPGASTIMHYLNGTRELKIELIPYIAEVLGVFEQELFDEGRTLDYLARPSGEAGRVANIIALCKYAPDKLLAKIEAVLENNKECVLRNIKELD